MSQDKEREDFEAWYFDKFMRPPAKDEDGFYIVFHARDAWEGWQARAALASQQAVKGEPVAWALLTNGKPNAPRGRTLSWEPPCNESLQIAAIEGESWVPLFASPPSREPQWQPIETAPKDGTAFWAFSPDLIDPEFNPNGGAECAWNGDEFIAWVWNPHQDFSYGAPTKPTHWMPLPQPPGIHSREGGSNV